MTGNPIDDLQALVRDLEADPRGLGQYAGRLSTALGSLDVLTLPPVDAEPVDGAGVDADTEVLDKIDGKAPIFEEIKVELGHDEPAPRNYGRKGRTP